MVGDEWLVQWTRAVSACYNRSFVPIVLGILCPLCGAIEWHWGQYTKTFFQENPQCWDVFRDKTVLPVQIVSRNNDRVNLHSVVPHPYLLLQFKSFQEDCCAQVLHPGYGVGIPCQVSYWVVNNWLQWSRGQNTCCGAEVLNTVRVLERWVASLAIMLGLRPSHNPSLTEKRENRDESIKVVITT